LGRTPGPAMIIGLKGRYDFSIGSCYFTGQPGDRYT
jgi:hypothetical protein